MMLSNVPSSMEITTIYALAMISFLTLMSVAYLTR